MLSYKKLYLKLFNSVTDGINALERFDGVKALYNPEAGANQLRRAVYQQ